MKHTAIRLFFIIALCLAAQVATAPQLAMEAAQLPQQQESGQKLSMAKGSQSPPAGFITFAVNAHDWRFVEDSGNTLLQLIGLFEKLKVRGDFYVTAPLIERYAQKRPDVIALLKQSSMTISYHVRAPHPLWRGFSGPLREKGKNETAAVLRDYESYQLDLKTGGLNRNETGGYRYVEQAFGRKSVAVGTSDAPPQVKAVSSRVYADLGARMAVYYHESGTRLEQPFEYRDGLLVRPSDFSVTRFASPQNPNGIFWWNMVGTPKAVEFDPVELLKKQLAAWPGKRPPFITVLIHENDFYRQGGPGWNSIYFEGEGQQARPRRPPFDLDTPPGSRPRTREVREAIFAKYEELLTYAAQYLKVVTSEDIVAMASAERSGMRTSTTPPSSQQGLPPFAPPPRMNQNPPKPGSFQTPLEGPVGRPALEGRFDRTFLRIASPACGNEGVAAEVLVPKQPRYADSAPVVRFE